MALDVTGIRRDGVYGGEWAFPVRTLTDYHVASGAGSALVANLANFVPTAGRLYWMGVTGDWFLQVHDGVGYVDVHGVLDGVLLRMASGIYQNVDDGTQGTFRFQNRTGLADRVGFTWRQVE